MIFTEQFISMWQIIYRSNRILLGERIEAFCDFFFPEINLEYFDFQKCVLFEIRGA